MGNHLVLGWHGCQILDVGFGKRGTKVAKAANKLEGFVGFGEVGQNFGRHDFVGTGNCIEQLARKASSVGVFVGSDFVHGDANQAVFDNFDFYVGFAGGGAEFLEFGDGETLIAGVNG